MNKKKYSDDIQGICNQKYSFAWTAISLEQSSGLHASCHLDVSRQSHVSNCYTGSWRRLSQQRVCCCVDRKAEAWIKVSSLWDPNRPPWGEQNHKHGTQELIHIRTLSLLFFTWGIWGCYFVDSQDSDWINEPAVLYFFLLSGIYI